jgi:GNAT superfamily N-acetyltransferase
VTRVAQPADLSSALYVWQLANIARGKAPSQQRIARVEAKLADPAALVLVAAEDQDTVGMALAEPGRDDDGTGRPLAELCHISMVFVHPDQWGKRIGQLLLDAVAENAAGRGYTLLQVWTGQSNERARRLYLRAGFQPSGRVEDLDSGEPVIHLIRALAS